MQMILLVVSMLFGAWGADRAGVYVFDSSLSPVGPSGGFRGFRVMVDGNETREIKIASRLAGRNLLSPDASMANSFFELSQIFYRDRLGRVGYDTKGSPINIVINASRNVPDFFGLRDNAYWDSANQHFVFGHGNETFLSFVGALEVVGHEFTHAVISSTSKLKYEKESGALNEHLADVFGIIIRKQNFPTHRTPYLVGDTILTEKSRQTGATALRDMASPNKGLIWQPKSVSEIPAEYGPNCQPSAANDNCGVHVLSGIPNRAAVEIIESLGWDTSRQIFYRVMTERLRADSDFSDYRRAVVQECEAILNRNRCAAVIQAFNRVGIRP